MEFYTNLSFTRVKETQILWQIESSISFSKAQKEGFVQRAVHSGIWNFAFDEVT